MFVLGAVLLLLHRFRTFPCFSCSDLYVDSKGRATILHTSFASPLCFHSSHSPINAQMSSSLVRMSICHACLARLKCKQNGYTSETALSPRKYTMVTVWTVRLTTSAVSFTKIIFFTVKISLNFRRTIPTPPCSFSYQLYYNKQLLPYPSHPITNMKSVVMAVSCAAGAQAFMAPRWGCALTLLFVLFGSRVSWFMHSSLRTDVVYWRWLSRGISSVDIEFATWERLD